MKKIFPFIVLALLTLAIGCGSSTEGDNTQETTKVPKGMMELDLGRYGIQAIMLIPDSSKARLDIEELSSGVIEIRIGKHFEIQLAQEADIELKKTDLAGDLLYKTSIISDEPNAILYSSELPDGSQAFIHFYVAADVNGVSYEVRDIESDISHPQKTVEQMLESAKSLKAKPQS